MTTAATIEKTVTTYNYLLSFKGWAQCRLAVDPDPSNAPRGVSGYTFAVPGEPDLDQIINFQNRESVIQRSHCPKIGVDVRSGVFYKARVNGDEQEFEHREEIDEKHPLYRARVDLCGNPVFDSRNSTIVYNGYGLISPFELQVESLCQKTRISRRYDVCPQNPVTDLASIPIDRRERNPRTAPARDRILVTRSHVCVRTGRRQRSGAGP